MTSRQHPLASARSLFGALFLGLTVAACDGTGSSSHTSTGVVGRSGGTLAVTSGELAGTSLVIPVFALSEVTRITIDQGSVASQPDVDAIGPAAVFSPSELEFEHDASAILVFRADDVPEATPSSDFVVKRSDSRGRITNIVPNFVKQREGKLLAFLPKFSTYWVALKKEPFVLADYWPMRNGDVYEYDNGVVLTLSETAAEPHLNWPVIKATFMTASSDSGLYLERNAFGETFFLGRFSVTGGFQELEDAPMLFLPELAELGDSGQTQSSLRGFEPYGSAVPTFSVHEELTTTLVTGGSLNTPIGQFADVIEIEIISEREETTPGGTAVSSTVRDRLWLARGIGPVHIALQGLPLGQVTGGVVAGVPLTGN